ncbi:carboxymuconolactone decarboxylase family protein [Pseudoruegeria sp. SK021]|uniref:carboxymuconolactone decarboxylase family protein n=1 Tax=Pseudoruegeria sp. SK021 TaxID=1933035 RepID=UPI000A255AEB|nr:carboxymuconolactone decarboxylase family protein [Pseudoruegeria sp. SK021]OSP56705.1 carboxymuconolactone decarboxylase [Pseudoruegeria sp. SK021]
MADFTLHTADTAPEASQPLIEKSKKAFGRLPGLHAVMAEAPGLLESYQVAHTAFANSSFDADETTVVWQTINVEHACHYCVPAHTGIALSMGVDASLNDALRDETPLPTAHLEALRTFTLQVVRQRGEVSDEQVQTFLDAGYTKRQVLEVVLGVAQKVMSNFTNHLAQTPIDEPFRKFAWEKKSA